MHVELDVKLDWTVWVHFERKKSAELERTVGIGTSQFGNWDGLNMECKDNSGYMKVKYDKMAL